MITKLKRKNTKPEKNENVKTQNGVKKFPNHLGRWTADHYGSAEC